MDEGHLSYITKLKKKTLDAEKNSATQWVKKLRGTRVLCTYLFLSQPSNQMLGLYPGDTPHSSCTMLGLYLGDTTHSSCTI